MLSGRLSLRAEGTEKYSEQLAASSRQRLNAHCTFINYHLAFYLNDSSSVICVFSMINANWETGDMTVRLGTERSAASAKKCEMLSDWLGPKGRS